VIDKNIKNFIQPIKEELKIFHKQFSLSMKSRVGLVDLVTKYILRQKGKKIRPTLVLLSAKTLGEINESTYRAAILVELLHTATLIHDDVVDSAETRRGLPSINSVWKNKIAVLMGDYLLSRGLLLSVDNNDFSFLKVITNTVKRMSEGELLQIQKTRKLNNDEETYLKIISDKTASLFSTCTQVGALSVTNDLKLIENFKKFGEYLGIAFQIKDDILDFDGKMSIIGKPVGADLKDKKLTLPLIAAFAKASESEIKEIKRRLKGEIKSRDFKFIVDFVKRYNGIDYSLNKAKEFSQKALDCINGCKNSESKQALTELVNFIIERKN
jgi:octaprenyl-diphosphate synthase